MCFLLCILRVFHGLLEYQKFVLRQVITKLTHFCYQWNKMNENQRIFRIIKNHCRFGFGFFPVITQPDSINAYLMSIC